MKQISLKVVDNLKCVMPTVMKLVKKNQKLHNPDSPLLIGEVKDGDVVMEVDENLAILKLMKKSYHLHVLFNQLCYKILLDVVI